MRIIAVVILLMVAVNADAQRFEIEETTDRLSRETYLRAAGLKLCQVKDEGFAAKCAVLQLAWQPSAPDLVAVRIEIPDLTSVLEVAVNVDGTVRRYGADVPVTDIDYDRGLQVAAGAGFTSANVFVLPVAVLQSLASNAESGILRVSGTHNSVDVDFWRKAKMRGVPADELREFLKEIVAENNNAD
jgi:hypothetical protein